MTGSDSSVMGGRRRIGENVIRGIAFLLILSTGVKIVLPHPAAEFLDAMGYAGTAILLLATVEFATALLLLFTRTRAIGLLFVSSYFGGAIAAHIAIHPVATQAPFVSYISHHPLVGAIVPLLFLAIVWLGAWLRYPEVLWNAGGSSVLSGNSRMSATNTAAV